MSSENPRPTEAPVPLDLNRIRSDIPALAESIYMNTGGTGPLPSPVADSIADQYRSAFQGGPDIPAVRGPIIEEFEQTRQTVASFLGVTPEEIALLRSVSEGLSTVAYGMDWNAGDEVIVTEEEHPTGIMVWLNLAAERGIRIRKMPLVEDRAEMLSGLEALINDRTRLVCISHVTTDTGTRLPAADICKLAHERGVPVALDAAQSSGQFPIDLREMDCDFYAGTGHKWLLGGWGVGYFYIRRDRVEEIKVSWTGSGAGTLDRHGLSDDLEFHDTARKFEFGGRHHPLYNAMGKGIEYIDAVGSDNIEARSFELSDRLKAGIAEIPGAVLRSPESREFSTGIVTFSVAGLDGDQVNSQMFERWRVLGRPALDHSAMRLCCAFFIEDREIDTVIEGISALANENR
jgi:isopenicillin-N epimerase/cysteine desulfurase/selenocysteine lyase